MDKTCNRCKTAPAPREICWYCGEPLCGPCWEEKGHCGHPEADAANKEARLSITPEQWEAIRERIRQRKRRRDDN